MDLDRLRAQLTADEGVRDTLYFDTAGVPTIGIGHNLHVPLSPAAITAIFTDDLTRVLTGLRAALPWFDTLDDVRQRVLVNMAFNLGVDGLLRFRETLAFVVAQQYTYASAAMLDSLWARQVGGRAQRLAFMMKTGRDPA